MNAKKPSQFRPRGKAVLMSVAAAVGAVALLVTSCTATIENRDPTGERLPRIEGETLEGESRSLPPAETSVLLIGYRQKAQFDADRWLVGLLQAPPDAQIIEVPTIEGLFPRMIAGTIDGGMRSGIPSEDWESVVTVYGSDAREIVEFTGNQGGRNIRVLLVDSEGVVRWFHDRGFSAGKLLDLVQAVEDLASE